MMRGAICLLLVLWLPGLGFAGPEPEPTDVLPLFEAIGVDRERVGFVAGAYLDGGEWAGWSAPLWPTARPGETASACELPRLPPAGEEFPVVLGCDAQRTWFAMAMDECFRSSDPVVYLWQRQDDSIQPLVSAFETCEQPLAGALVGDSLYILSHRLDRQAWVMEDRLQRLDLGSGQLDAADERVWRGEGARNLAYDPFRQRLWLLSRVGISFMELATGAWEQRYFHLRLREDDQVQVLLADQLQPDRELWLFHQFATWPITRRNAFADAWSMIDAPTLAHPALIPFYLETLDPAATDQRHYWNGRNLLNALARAGLADTPEVQRVYWPFYLQGDYGRRSWILEHLPALGWDRERVAEEEYRLMKQELSEGRLRCTILEEQRPGAERLLASAPGLAGAETLFSCVGRAPGWEDFPERVLAVGGEEAVGRACDAIWRAGRLDEAVPAIVRAAARIGGPRLRRNHRCWRALFVVPRDEAEVEWLIGLAAEEASTGPLVLDLLNRTAPYMWRTLDDWVQWWNHAPPEQRARVVEPFDPRGGGVAIGSISGTITAAPPGVEMRSPMCEWLHAGRPLPTPPPGQQRAMQPCPPPQ